jgi:hypothetical protein
MEMRGHVRFSNATGLIVDITAVEIRWKLQVEEEMVAVWRYRGSPHKSLYL